MKGYKAYKKGLTCRGFQYKEGEVFENDNVKCCSPGFHFCENPLDVLNYYDLCDSEITEVEALGHKDKPLDSNDTKYATNKIKIGAKLDLKEFVKASFDFLWSNCNFEKSEIDYSKVATSGDFSQVATSGDYSKVATSGNSSKVAINGEYSVGASIGINSKIKGRLGNWITLSEWEWNKEKGIYVPVCVKSTQIDGEIIKADTYYMLVDGEFKEV